MVKSDRKGLILTKPNQTDQGPAEPQDESGRGTNQEPAEQARAPQQYNTNQGPAGQVSRPCGSDQSSARRDEPGSCRTNQGPAGRIRTRGTDQDPRDQPKHCGTDQYHRKKNQGPAGRIISAGQITDQGPARDRSVSVVQSKAPRNKTGPRRTNQGPAGKIWAPQNNSGPVRQSRARGTN